MSVIMMVNEKHAKYIALHLKIEKMTIQPGEKFLAAVCHT